MTAYHDRPTCYSCYRPASSCICGDIHCVDTQSCFVILMHQKEFHKTKNTTGRMTHLSLPHSHLFVGIDFSHHAGLNQLLNDPSYTPFILYPHEDAHNLSNAPLQLRANTKALFILIDSTWGCSKKMMKQSSNLHHLPRVSFTPTRTSAYEIKVQPQDYCLSTIETTQTILELLTIHQQESIPTAHIESFLDPFKSMVSYQVLKAKTENSIRYKAVKKWL